MYYFFSWLTIHNGLLTLNVLQKRGIPLPNMCVVCKKDEESRDHLFFGCDFSRHVWSYVLQKCNIYRRIGIFDHELHWAECYAKFNPQGGIVVSLCFALSITFIWAERNARIF